MFTTNHFSQRRILSTYTRIGPRGECHTVRSLGLLGSVAHMMTVAKFMIARGLDITCGLGKR